MAKAQSKAEIRNRFIKQAVDSSTATGKNLEAAAKQTEGRKQHSIDKNEPPKDDEEGKTAWDGDTLDLENLGKPFDRTEINEDFLEAIKDAENPGVTGDLQVCQLQGDYLACMERAFRSRHATRCRHTMHAAARRYGHGHNAGVIRKGVLGYLEGILKVSKDSV